jgi:hypothetical protein
MEDLTAARWTKTAYSGDNGGDRAEFSERVSVTSAPRAADP